MSDKALETIVVPLKFIQGLSMNWYTYEQIKAKAEECLAANEQKAEATELVLLRAENASLKQCRQELMDVTNACCDLRVNLTHTLEQCVRDVYSKVEKLEQLRQQLAVVEAVLARHKALPMWRNSKSYDRWVQQARDELQANLDKERA